MDDLLEVYPGEMFLLVAPRRQARKLMNTLIARLALTAPVQVLDGGNMVDVYAIARWIRQQTWLMDEALQRIQIARAFTCYQLLAMLKAQSASSSPIIVLDLLSMFYDESVSLVERRRLLDQALLDLQRLCQPAPVAVSSAPPPDGQPEELLARLMRCTTRVWRYEPPSEIIPDRLF